MIIQSCHHCSEGGSDKTRTSVRDVTLAAETQHQQLVGVALGPPASAQVQAHRSNQRLELNPRRAASAGEESDLCFSVSHTTVK